jgi:hypothetical protein
LTTCYDISLTSSNILLRGLVFAFTTSIHIYGGAERTLKQLETGAQFANMLGGKDREDGVGHVMLGMWFATKLRGEFRFERH